MQPTTFNSLNKTLGSANDTSQFSGVNTAFAPKSIQPSSNGGTVIHPSLTSNALNPTTSQTPSLPTQQKTLADFINKTTPTSGGGSITTQGGNVTGYNPAPQFSIDTNNINSGHLIQNTTMGDINSRHQSLQDYVNAVAQANGYSPEYINAYQQQQQAQLGQAQLGLNSAQLNSNLYTGNNLPGDTMQYAQGATAKAQAQNTLEQSQNAIQQLAANQALNTAQLQRTGNITAAQAQLQYSPTATTQQNAIAQYNSLQQQYPGANLPPINPNGDLYQQLQNAHAQIASSAPYQAEFQQTYTTPGGGLGTYSKLNPSGGGSEIVSGSQAAAGSADAQSLGQQQNYLDTTTRAYQTATSNLGTLQQFMQDNGLNNANLPIINQIENKVKAKALDPGVVAAFQSSIQGLRAEYSQVLARGGARSVETDNAAASLIPDNLSPAQLATVTKQLSLEGQNAIKESQSQVNTIKSRLSSPGVSTPNEAVVGNSKFQFVNGKWVVGK